MVMTRICIQPNEMVEHALKKAHLFSLGKGGGGDEDGRGGKKGA
jgi:hypothetical protein